MNQISRQDRFRGLLLGIAVGDALGLPAEGLPPQRARRLFGTSWRHRLIFGRGMISDDTEHVLFVSQSLLVHPEAADLFARRLARSLRWWLAALPAGVGWATLRAVVRLWCGVPPERSGVFSAGNGAAMRAAPIGAFFASSREKIDAFAAAASRITHSDPRALTGAKTVAYAAAWVVRENGRRPASGELRDLLNEAAPDDLAWRSLVERLVTAERQGLAVTDFARALGLDRGVTGYVYHSVPVALYGWWRHFGDFRATLASVLDCGGDTDTTGSIAGGLAGLVVGEAGLPTSWARGIAEWPRGTDVLRAVADRLAEGGGPAVSYFWPGVLPRNLLFLMIVLLHGVRRLFPPY